MAHTLSRFLSGGDALSRLHEHANRLQRLQRTLEALLPAYLANSCTVANLKGDTLVLLARTGAGAAKLRQIVPSLQQGFANAGVCIGSIQIKIIPQNAAAVAPKTVTPRILPSGGRQSIETFCATLPPDAPLRESLERLLSRSVTD